MALSSCPAFVEGCPFATEKEMISWVQENRPESLEKCPAFMEGQCPFKSAKDLSDIKEVLNQLPQSHGNGGKQHEAVVSLFAALHDSSSKVKNELGNMKECAIFSNGECPFKGQLCSDGVPLIDAIEFRSWDFMITKEKHTNLQNIENKITSQNNVNNDDEHDYEIRVVTVEVSKLLKEGTQTAHKAAENVHFVREFIHGRVERKAYEEMMINLYYIYNAMEQAIDNNGNHPLVAPVHFPDQLHRTSSLEKDLCYLIGPNWREKVNQPSYVAQAYINRLQYLSINYPELLVPHAYTRYLGDLSGGQVLKRSAIKILGKHNQENNTNYNKIDGVQFYNFKLIQNMNEFKKMYRSKLDLIGKINVMSIQLADNMVAEANYAFELNTALFRELDNFSGFSNAPIELPSVPIPSTLHKQYNLKQKNESNTTRNSIQSTSEVAAAAGCPFASFIKPDTPNPHAPSSKDHGSATNCPVASANVSSSASLNEFRQHRDVIIKESKCPFHKFGLMDVAIVLVLTAIMLLLIPSKSSSNE